MAVVEVLNTSKARDSVLAMCAGNFRLISAIYNIHLKITHISGKKNSQADLLSRFYLFILFRFSLFIWAFTALSG